MMQRDRDRVYRGLVRFVKLGDVEDDHVPNRTSWYDCEVASTVQSASLGLSVFHGSYSNYSGSGGNGRICSHKLEY